MPLRLQYIVIMCGVYVRLQTMNTLSVPAFKGGSGLGFSKTMFRDNGELYFWLGFEVQDI